MPAPISLVAVGQKWTATIANLVIAAVNAMGSNSITPTSVAGAGVSLSGSKVVVAAASSISLNGCFTGTYDAYEVEWDLTSSGAANLQGLLRLSGVDATTAYDSQRSNTVNATTTSTQSLNAANFVLEALAITGKHNGVARIVNPAIAVATTGFVNAGATANPMAAATGGYFFATIQHRTLTAYDGFTMTPSVGTLTGWIKVRGIA